LARASLLSGIAIAAGTGLAIGCLAFGRRRAHQPVSLEPLIERLDRIEARVNQANHPTPEVSDTLPVDIAAVGASLATIDERLTAQSQELELLRKRAADNEKLAEAEARLTERRFKDAASALPTQIEAVVAPRMEGLREHLNMELKESIASTLGNLDQSFGTRISSRITAFEDKLLEHSTALADLSRQTSQTNANLQKLVEAVERLCERRGPEPVPLPAPGRLPVSEQTRGEMPERQLTDSRGVAIAPEKSRIVREDESPRPRRFTFGHVMIAAGAAFIVRAFRAN
jgi:chromosome segregation ATPase